VPENRILFKKSKSRLNNKTPENMYKTKKILGIRAKFYIYAYSPVFVVYSQSYQTSEETRLEQVTL